MKNEQLAPNSISESLLNKNVYHVLLSSRENPSNLKGDLALLRKKFFENKRKGTKIQEEISKNGVNGKINGKLSRHNFVWKKHEGGIITEECFKNSGTYTLLIRDFNGAIRSKIFFNKNMLWLKTEYYSVSDYVNAELIFKPILSENAIERFEYDPVKKNYISTSLYPTPYDSSSSEQSFIDYKVQSDMLLVSMEGGEFLYCTKEEIENRNKLKEEVESKDNLLTSVWVNNEELISTPDEIEPAEETEIKETEETIPEETTTETSENKPEEETNEEPEPQEEVAPEKTIEEIKEEKPEAINAKAEFNEENGDNIEKLIYTGTLIEGKRNGRGRTDRKSGLTAFDGEYVDNKRNGFGCSYYKNGNLSYAGFWKNDKKDGMGVSFRNSDHAVQITNWKEGKPDVRTTIFDSDGYLKYSGNIKDGVREGICITYNKENGSTFAGKWLSNGESGCGSLFDSEGNLIYAGYLKDGKRHGQGTEFDKNGEVVFTGIFDNDEYKSGTIYKKL